MVSFYRDRLGKSSPQRHPIDLNVISHGKALSMEQKIDLCKPFTDKDIKDAMFSIPNHKSLGPNGFSSGFFKSTWSITGPMVCCIIRNFLSMGHMPLFLSTTKLILLPKMARPQSASNFRPISCCNVIYKVISKFLSAGLKEVLPSLIDHCQGAFVRGREIIYNVLICQDLAQGYHRKHISTRCMMKVDLKKAFDSVHWHFLELFVSHLLISIGSWPTSQTLNFPSTSMAASRVVSRDVEDCAKVISFRHCSLCL